MTREQHTKLAREHREKADAALAEFIKDRNRLDKWEEFKAEDKLCRKHWGISQAMFTKWMKKKGLIS